MKRLRVLVVEDEEAIALPLVTALRKRGHESSLAGSAEQALALPQPDVLITDLGLPGMGGLELLEKLQQLGKLPPALVMAGLPSFEDCRTAMRLGAVDFLSKPFPLDEFLQAVENAVENGRKTSEGGARFENDYPAEEETPAVCAREVAAFALRSGVGPAARARAASTTWELVENACRHAYPPGAGEGRVSVRAEHIDGNLRVTVADEGCGFDATSARLDALQPLVRAQEPAQSGLARAALLSEDLSLSSGPEGSSATATFDVRPAVFEEEPYDLSELDFLDPRTIERVLAVVHQKDSAPIVNLSPALAVTVGRLLSGPSSTQAEQTSLWS